jgi:hypothetical protein
MFPLTFTVPGIIPVIVSEQMLHVRVGAIAPDGRGHDAHLLSRLRVLIDPPVTSCRAFEMIAAPVELPRQTIETP